MGWIDAQLRLIAAMLLVLGAGAAPEAAAAGAYNARVEGTNPSLAQKQLSYDAWVAAQGAPPDVLVLGSSRSVQFDPRVIRAVSGATAFNAGVSNGAARELLATATYADLRTPGQLPQLVIFLDLEAFDNRRPTVRVTADQRRMDAVVRACPEPTSCGAVWVMAARRIAADARARQKPGDPWRSTQRPDGRQINGSLEKMEAQGVDLAAVRARRIGIRVRSYSNGGFNRMHASPKIAFARTVALANQRGITPTVVLTTMHPACIRICGPAGWNDRRREVRAWLAQLQQNRSLRMIDLSLPAVWGGSGASFYDEIHLRQPAADTIVRRLDRLGVFEPTG